MANEKDSEESMFILDEMKTVIKEAIDEAIGSQQFNHDKVTHWTNGVSKSCIKRLAILNKPFNDDYNYAKGWGWHDTGFF